MDYNMIQTVKTHTRITNYTETTIDHVISNQSSLTSIVTHMSLSDHQIILSCWGKSKRKGSEPSASVHLKSIDIEKTQKKIDQIDWKPWMMDNQHSNLNPMYDSFHEKIQSCIEKNRQSNNIFIDQPGIPDDAEFANIMVCKVASLFDELVSIQFRQLVATQAPETHGILNAAFYGFVNEWRTLSGQRQCGFSNPPTVDPHVWDGVVEQHDIRRHTLAPFRVRPES